jgi:hypothetical protein
MPFWLIPTNSGTQLGRKTSPWHIHVVYKRTELTVNSILKRKPVVACHHISGVVFILQPLLCVFQKSKSLKVSKLYIHSWYYSCRSSVCCIWWSLIVTASSLFWTMASYHSLHKPPSGLSPLSKPTWYTMFRNKLLPSSDTLIKIQRPTHQP